MRTLSHIECFNVGCTNEASVTINGDHVCTQCAQVDLTVVDAAYVRACEVHGTCDYDSFKAAFCADHWCNKHAVSTGEGDICGQCEAEFDELRTRINFALQRNSGSLSVITTDGYTFMVPVYTFDDAKRVFHTLQLNCIKSCALLYFDGGLTIHKFH